MIAGGRVRGWALRVLAALAAVALAAVALAAGLVTRGTLVDPARFARPEDSVTVLDRHGAPLRHVRVDGVDRRWVPLGDVAPVMVSAVLAAEDRDFLHHRGVDLRAVVRSAARDLLPWTRLTGASTLTQQLVKLVYGRRPGLYGKAVEALRALSLEREFTKAEILEQYLNRIPFGDGIQGVGRASEEYFGHGPATLNAAEAALLAGVPQAPSITEPRRHLARAVARRDWVLARMRANGTLDAASYGAARQERPEIRDVPPRPWEAPRFVDAVVAGWRRGVVRRDGGAIATSLDLDLQRRAEEVLGAAVARLESRGARNGAAVVVANATGEVLAYVGAARATPDAAGGALDLLDTPRQPGSSLKPFVYELFFERGATAATVLDDVAVAMHGARGSSFEARDYDGRERGPVRARVALASSLNLAALDAARRVGGDPLVRRLRALGFHPAGDASRYGAAVVLGGVDVTALELARAWVTLARGGTAVPLSLAPDATAAGARPVAVMTPGSAQVAWDILADGGARADAFGADLVDAAGGVHFALKTGTSQGWRDAWAAVATDRLTVVVWLGDPGGAPMAQVSGFEAAAPVAARILGIAMAREWNLAAPVPVRAGPEVRLVEAEVCAWSGLRAGPRCRSVVRERFAPATLPRERCEAHDAQGAYLLPERYRQWAERARPSGVALTRDPVRAGSEAMGAAGAAGATEPAPVVVEPRDGARWLIDRARGPMPVLLRATVRGAPAGDVTWEVDGATLTAPRWVAAPGTHRFVAVRRGARSRPAVLDVAMAGAPGG